MPQTAERVAEQWRLTRDELDAFALRSHERALDAIKNGRFEAEIVPVPVKDGEFAVDEGPRADTSLDVLARLRPVNGPDGLVTAGNSASLNDGAAAVVVASERFVERARPDPAGPAGRRGQRRGAPPRSWASARSRPPARRSTAPAGSVDDLDAVELNEAFASQSLACMRDLGLDDEIVNADGGAIALGHPLGCLRHPDPGHPAGPARTR